jgi:hypothetical protein
MGSFVEIIVCWSLRPTGSEYGDGDKDVRWRSTSTSPSPLAPTAATVGLGRVLRLRRALLKHWVEQ